MAKTFSADERRAIARMSLDGLVNITRASGVVRIGANSRFLLTEFGMRFDMPADGVSLTVIRNINLQRPSRGRAAFHWGIYSEDRAHALYVLPSRRWDAQFKCNIFPVASDNDTNIFDPFNRLYAKTVVITEQDFRIENGTGSTEWLKPTLYQLSDAILQANLGDVLRGYFHLRPTDGPRYLALHGEIDEKYRTLFDDSLHAKSDVLSTIDLQTRHRLLLFRLPQFDGKVRYLSYSAVDNVPLDVAFAETRQLNMMIAQFKEAQQRLGAPLVVGMRQSLLQRTSQQINSPEGPG